MKPIEYIRKKQGQRIKECLKERNVTGKELAEKLNYSPQHISYILNGKRTLTKEMAINIANYLNRKEVSRFEQCTEASPFSWIKDFVSPDTAKSFDAYNSLEFKPLDYRYLLCESDFKDSFTELDPPAKKNINSAFPDTMALLLHLLGYDLSVDIANKTVFSVTSSKPDPHKAFHDMHQQIEKDPLHQSTLVRINDGVEVTLSPFELQQLFKDYISAIDVITKRTFEKHEWKEALDAPDAFIPPRHNGPLWEPSEDFID